MLQHLSCLLSQGKAADAAGIQFRMLNASKGPAVRGPRAQMDRQLYKQEIQQLLADVKRLEIIDCAVTNVLLQSPDGDATYRAPAQSSIVGVLLASGVCKCNTQFLHTRGRKGLLATMLCERHVMAAMYHLSTSLHWHVCNFRGLHQHGYVSTLLTCKWSRIRGKWSLDSPQGPKKGPHHTWSSSKQVQCMALLQYFQIQRDIRG